jgi:hypothetical protein
MLKKTLILLSLLLCFSVTINSSFANKQVDEFDLRYYHPENFGLKDLVFEIRITDLVKRLNAGKTLGQLEDVYYKIYWIFPGEYRIVINGLPNGFSQIKRGLKEMIKARLDYVIPLKLAPKIRAYKLSTSNTSRGVLVKGVDQTHTRPVNEINLLFDARGKLLEFKTFSPVGVNNSKMELNVKPWSHNKWVVDKIEVTNSGTQVTTITSELDYTTVSGFGFPEKIDITTKIKPYEANSKKVQVVKSTLLFSKFEVNSGKAQRYIMKGLKK